MRQKLIGSIEDIQAQPETYRRVWEVYHLGKLDEGLYLVVGTGYKLFIHYQNNELYVTDNHYSTVSLTEEGY